MTSTQNSARPDSSGRGFIILIVAIIAAGLFGVALLATNRGEARAELADSQTTDVEIAGDPLPPMTESGVPVNDPARGAIAPEFTGTDFAGNEVTIGADGRPKVIYFLAHWCPHCQTEVPLVQGMIDDGLQPAGLDIYAVSTSVDAGRGNFPPQYWLDDEGWTPPTIRDDADSSALISHGAGGFPYTVYLDGENRVLSRSSGGLDTATIGQLWELTASSG